MYDPNRVENVNAHETFKMKLESEEKAQKEKEMEALLKETEVGKKLTSKISKIVIILILMVMFSIPLFNIDTYVMEYEVASAGVASIG